LEDLKRTNYNSLGGDEVIYPGQQLVIPASAKRPVPSYAKPSYATPSSSAGAYNSKTSVYNNYSTSAPVMAAPPAKKTGLGQVTTGVGLLHALLVVALTPGCHSVGYADHAGCHQLNVFCPCALLGLRHSRVSLDWLHGHGPYRLSRIEPCFGGLPK
jgi:hypothetical protein